MHVVVCGGGVIGACCAYFLTLRGANVSVIERTGIASAASGKLIDEFLRSLVERHGRA